MHELSISHRKDPAKEIETLTEVLNELLDGDYLIAGGYVRDWFQDQPFNDIDVYVFDQNTDLYALLKRTQFFTVVRHRQHTFLDTVFTRDDKVYKVQFMLWYANPTQVLDSFDFEHCRFAIPFHSKKRFTRTYKTSLSDRVPIVCSETSFESIETQKLITTRKTKNRLAKLESDSYTSHSLFILESLVKRCKKFKSRGMEIPYAEITRPLEKFMDRVPQDAEQKPLPRTPGPFGNISPYARSSSHTSCFLEGSHYVSDRTSKYTPQQIAANLVEEWIQLHDPEDRVIFLVSPSLLVRKIAAQLLKENNPA